MKKFSSENIRNIVLAGQRGVGKTSLAEAMLYRAKATTRLGSVDEGSSILDFEPEEQKRHSTVGTAVASVNWKSAKINIIDTPGASDFMNDTRLAIESSDSVMIIIGSTDGVQVGTEKVWKFAEAASAPRAIFITGMDKERANFQAVVDDIKESLTRTATPLYLPIGKEQGFKGIVNILSRKAYMFEGDSVQETEIPSDMQDMVDEAFESLMEVVAESDEALTDKYLEEGELTEDEIRNAFPTAVKEGLLVPVLCGSAKHLIGIETLFDFIVKYMPSPVDRVPFKTENEDPEQISYDFDGFSAVVLKTFSTDIGRMSVLRVISGGLSADSGFFNTISQKKERFSQLYLLTGKKRDTISEISAGDIAAVAKLKYTNAGDTLSDEAHSELKIKFNPTPNPVAILAVHPKSKSDEDKLGAKLNDIVSEDPALRTWRDQDSSELLLGGMGQMHLDVTIEKLKRSGVEVETTLPKIPYKETITKKSPLTEGKHKKQSGGRGQFGVCYIELEPLSLEGEAEFEFVDNIFGGAIPKQWIPSVEKGIKDRMARGVIAGYPVINVRVYLKDGKYHPVDSSDAAFQMAGSKGFQAAVKNSAPVLLEPVYNLEVTVPQDYMGTIMGDITSKRGRPMGSEQKGKNVTIQAQVPLSEIQRYSADLESMTSGRGSFYIEFNHYERVPNDIAQKIINSSKLEEEED